MSKKLLNEKELEKAHKRLSSIDHPSRLEIIRMLLEKPKMNVTQIYSKLKIEQAAASHHLKLLRDSGVLDVNRDGKARYYSINQSTYEYIIDCVERLNK